MGASFSLAGAAGVTRRRVGSAAALAAWPVARAACCSEQVMRWNTTWLTLAVGLLLMPYTRSGDGNRLLRHGSCARWACSRLQSRPVRESSSTRDTAPLSTATQLGARASGSSVCSNKSCTSLTSSVWPAFSRRSGCCSVVHARQTLRQAARRANNTHARLTVRQHGQRQS